MKKKISLVLLLGALLSFTFTACDEPSQIAKINKPVLKAAASENSTHFPLFQLFTYKTNEQCNTKVNDMVSHFFGSDSNKKIYYESGTDMAYIYNMAPDNSPNSPGNDVRSEGMSYGMMVTVQLDMKTQFDKLWKWAKTYMLKNNNGDIWFAWRCKTDGAVGGNTGDGNPAPDGEEYFALSLYFAHNRWGSSGTINYKAEADAIVNAMLNNPTRKFFGTSGASNNLITFSPFTTDTTDPSYHLPFFYELYAEFGGFNQTTKDRLNAIAKASRAYLKTTLQKNANGLNPDYTDYSGNAKELNSGDGHNAFKYDAWRTVMNVVLDYTFARTDAALDYGSWTVSGTYNGHYFGGGYTNSLLSFFESKNTNNLRNYPDRYQMNGTAIGSDHSPGLVAMNAVGARAATNWAMILRYANEFWDLPMPVGEYRYYNGCLYMLAMLYCTGNYNVIGPNNTFLYSKAQFGASATPNYDVVSLASVWTNRHITLTANQNDAEVKAQPENTSWTSQDWKIESVSGSTNVRLKNIWSGKYLNVQNQNENAKVVAYDLNTSWLSQQWRIESVPSSTAVRLKNVWSGRYLTVETNGDYANILSKSLNTSWTSQNWVIK